MIIIDDDGVMHKVLPMDTLDKIRTEIEQEFKDESEHPYGRGLKRAIEIIDKYRNEVNK